MNILVLSWRDPKHPLAGGAEQVMHEHMKGWVRAGHAVTLFSSYFKGRSRSEIINGVRVVRQGFQYLGVHFLAFLWYLFGDHQKFDLVVDQFHGVPFFTPLYVRKPKLAVIQETARKVWFLNPLSWPLNWVVGLLGYLVEPVVFLIYKGTPFVTGSESAKEDVSKLGISKRNITVVPHGVILHKFSVLPRTEKIKTVVYLGVLSKDKGIEDAIRCFAVLNRNGRYQFWVIGRLETENYGRKIVNLVKSLGLADKVKFWGFVSQEKKFTLLAKGHVLINPSIHEGWGLVNIEANAMGTPVVAYRSHGLVDSVEDGVSGILCKKNTPWDMAQEVFGLLTSDKRFDRMSESAVLWSKRFSWEKSRKQSLKLIESLV